MHITTWRVAPTTLPPFVSRRDFLVNLLGIDLDWRMHQLSDGQRRRVQIMLQMLRPAEVVLLDEITTGVMCAWNVVVACFTRNCSITDKELLIYFLRAGCDYSPGLFKLPQIGLRN